MFSWTNVQLDGAKHCSTVSKKAKMVTVHFWGQVVQTRLSVEHKANSRCHFDI